MKDSVWFIEGDIKSYFPTIDHDILMKLVARRIRDGIILKLIRTGLKARVFTQKTNQLTESFIPEAGTPQGGILSPLLSNIYLHELDQLMGRLATKYQGTVTATRRRKNPLNNALLRKGMKSEAQRLGIPSRDPFQTEYRNLKYIRYADDFLIGILGPRVLACEVRDEVQRFLKEKLKIELSIEKTHITHISRGVPFLGYVFGRKTLVVRQVYSGRTVKRKMTTPSLTANMKKLIEKMTALKVCTESGNPLPLFRYLRNPQIETNQRINRIIMGLSEWWSIADNRKQAVAFVAYLFRYSLAKMYAAKFHLSRAAAVFKLGGNDLSLPIGRKVKSVVGVGSIQKNEKIPGILYDRYHKIPNPKRNTLPKDWMPEHEKLLREENLTDFISYLQQAGLKRQSTNPIIKLG